MYWGASFEFQYPFYFLPKDAGFRGAVFMRCRFGVGLQGRDPIGADRRSQRLRQRAQGRFFCQCGMQFADNAAVRMSAGASMIWDSPFGPLRFDFAYPF